MHAHRRIIVPVLACLLMGLGGVRVASGQTSPPDSLQDAFLNDLEGKWTLEGHVMGDSVQYRAEASWGLGHQFLRLRMIDVQTPPQYEAHVYIGYDHSEDVHVAHWLDDTGGGTSRTIGTGHRDGDTLTFSFDYPEGPFRTIFERISPTRWRLRMRAKGDDGDWQPFAAYSVRSRSDP